jgi:hypothetical protein
MHHRKPSQRSSKPVAPPTNQSPAVRVPGRVTVKYDGADYFADQQAFSRAMACGQRLPIFRTQHCDEPAHRVPGAYFQAQYAADAA